MVIINFKSITPAMHQALLYTTTRILNKIVSQFKSIMQVLAGRRLPENRSSHGTQSLLCSMPPIPMAYLYKNSTGS